MSSSSSRIASNNYSATHSAAALQPNYSSSLPGAAPPPPQATLPPLPSNARSPQSIPSSSSSSAAIYSDTGYPPSPPESTHPDPLQLRQRGQSSPVTSRHRDWNGQDSTAMELGGSGQGRQSRRQSSSTTPRKLVDGREETREERRARKERERALRGEAAEDGASPTNSTRRRSSRSNGLPNSPSGGDDLSQLSLGSPPLASAATSRTTPSTSSKSVLTIALQRAQSAVLLDSANNVPAAISAYTQSVRLLKEVMQRVEEGARREKAKEKQRGYDRNLVREGESHEEFQRRVAKAERKERAKQDEARRLRVIHDTYEDRIRMLQTVGDPSNELNPPADAMQDSSSPSTPSTIHAHSPSAPSSTSTFAPELSRRSRSITSLGTVSTPPATFTPLGGPPPTLVLQHPTPGRPEELLNTAPAADIGNAMLIGSPPASPMDPKMPNLRPSPSPSPSYAPAPHGLAPSMARRPSIADEVIDEEGDETTLPQFSSRASISSDSTATSMSRAMTLNGPADPSIPFRHPASSYLSSSAPSSRSTPGIAIESQSLRGGVAAIDLTTSPADEEDDDPPRGGGHLPRSESYASSESDDIVPVTAMEYGVGWPNERMGDSEGEAEQTEREELSSRASSFGAGAVSPISMRRSESGQSSEAQSMRRGASGDSTSMQRTASGDSVSALSMRGSSLFGPGGFTQMSNLPPPPLNSVVHDQPSSSPRYSTPLAGIGQPPSSSRPRPGRSASLANAPTFAVSGSPTKRAGAGPPLISPSTHLGTISQRRRSPQPNGLAREPDYFGGGEVEDEEELDEEGHTVQGMPMRGGGGAGGGRPLSAEPSVASEFGLAPQAAGGFSSASLPTRFRTQSSPRPPLLSSQSEAPNGPPTMLGSAARSFSSSGGGYPRKGSIPGTSSGLSMPSTLPPLDRSNSSSSQGSFSETRDRDSRGSSPYTQSPNLSHSQSSLPSYTHSSAPSDTPTYSTFPRGSTSFPGALTSPPPPTASATATAAAASISTIRRPFHLLRQILESLDGQGAYITPRLFVPPQVWSQAGVKLVALETKVRMLDLLLSGLDSLSKVAVGWSEGRANVKGWKEELESFEGLMEGIQSTLSKKLGYGTGGKKMGSTSFSAWSSKLSRSLDRVANGRSLDKPDVYSEILAKVLRGANVIDLHLDLLATNSGPYSTLSPSDRARIEQRLKRASDFFGQVICRFVMRDVGMLVDKYVKRAGAWLGEG